MITQTKTRSEAVHLACQGCGIIVLIGYVSKSDFKKYWSYSKKLTFWHCRKGRIK